MKAHTFTDTRIQNVHGSKSHCGFICVCGHWCGFQIFPLSVPIKCSVPNNASQQSFLESHIFQYGSKLLLKRSGMTTCQVRKCTAFIEFVQYKFEDHETCIHVHHWLATNDFNYSDAFTHRLLWICAYIYIGLKAVQYFPSKDIVGNGVTSCIFYVFMKPWDFSYCNYLSSCF
jgi:hypothetical protein